MALGHGALNVTASEIRNGQSRTESAFRKKLRIGALQIWN
jgi:hypothetical protein